MKPLREKLTYANVVATLALFIAIGGASAFAASQLGKNSVGAKQLKKNSVTTAKIKAGAVTGAKIRISSLGTVPSAQTANRAQTADNLAAPEAWHIVGAAGEPPFENSWKDAISTPRVAFYKDREDVVHLKGFAIDGKSQVVFRLPAGFRPAGGSSLAIPMVCTGGSPCATFVAPGSIVGPGSKEPIYDNAVAAPESALAVSFDGIAFRAES